MKTLSCLWLSLKSIIPIYFKPTLNSQWSIWNKHRSQLTSDKVLFVKEKSVFIDIWQLLLSSDKTWHPISWSVSWSSPLCCDWMLYCMYIQLALLWVGKTRENLRKVNRFSAAAITLSHIFKSPNTTADIAKIYIFICWCQSAKVEAPHCGCVCVF